MVIPVPPKGRQQSGDPPQLSRSEVADTNRSAETESTEIMVLAGTSLEANAPPAYLPPSEEVADSVVLRDARRIWSAASQLCAPMYAQKKRVTPSDDEQSIVRQYSVAVYVTRTIRAYDMPIAPQAWAQRAQDKLPQTSHNCLAPLAHKLTDQFPGRYTLREGESWEAKTRYPRSLAAVKPVPKTAVHCPQYWLMVDATFRCDLFIENMMPTSWWHRDCRK